jgi:hypothetical protein
MQGDYSLIITLISVWESAFLCYYPTTISSMSISNISSYNLSMFLNQYPATILNALSTPSKFRKEEIRSEFMLKRHAVYDRFKC